MPKEGRDGLKYTFIELFKFDTFFCPIAALATYYRLCHRNPPGDQPLVRRQDGGGYTTAQFNQDLKHLLRNSFNYEEERICSHSFRAGIPSVLAKNGFSKDVIQVGSLSRNITSNTKTF